MYIYNIDKYVRENIYAHTYVCMYIRDADQKQARLLIRRKLSARAW